MTPDPGMSALVERMWERFRPLAQQRLAVLQDLADAVRNGDPPEPLRQEARAAAHKLAGALGTYGRSGSDQARQLELLLSSAAPLQPVQALVDALQEAVDPPGGEGVHPRG